MHTTKHISKNDFFTVLEKRLAQYEEAIIGTSKVQGMQLHMRTSTLRNIETIKKLDSQNNLFGDGFWGYGINNICDGIETNQQPDVESVKRIPGLNKHRESYRNLLLLSFKIENKSLFVSTFSIDSCSPLMNYNLNIKYELKDFYNAVIKGRSNLTIIEFFFKNIEKPIHFQLETYSFGGRSLSGEQLAKYYIETISQLADEVKIEANIGFVNPVKKSENLSHEIDLIEISLRNIISDVLIKSKGKEDFESLVTGDAKSQIKSCIREFIQLHPDAKESDFILLKSSIHFCNVEHLKKIILKDDNWQNFEEVFNNKEKVIKYFDQFNTLRKAVKHARELTDLVILEGKAAMNWFMRVSENRLKKRE